MADTGQGIKTVNVELCFFGTGTMREEGRGKIQYNDCLNYFTKKDQQHRPNVVHNSYNGILCFSSQDFYCRQQLRKFFDQIPVDMDAALTRNSQFKN